MGVIRLKWVAIAIVLVLFSVASVVVAEETPTASTPQPTPTIDRLAPPPTVPAPTQADDGAYLYWLNCMPCHGDRGQGLTDEWRAQYPPEESNCWQSGCHGSHGKEPPEGGFEIPKEVPALIGEGNDLARFGTLAQLYHYTRTTMPYEAPGNLPEEEYLAILAFIAKGHGIWSGTPLDKANIEQMRFSPATGGGEDQTLSQDQTLLVESEPDHEFVQQGQERPLYWSVPAGSVVLAFLAMGGIYLWRKQN